jgi:hypothetical protein
MDHLSDHIKIEHYIAAVEELEDAQKEINSLGQRLLESERREEFFKSVADTNLKFFKESEKSRREMSVDMYRLKQQNAELRQALRQSVHEE